MMGIPRSVGMGERAGRYLEFAGLAALLLAFFGLYSVKIADIDFWWHIAAGKQILAAGALPEQDPFSVYNAAGVWGQTVLKSQWLGQVFLYEIFDHFGSDGIVFAKAAILTACLALVYARCNMAGAAPLASFAVLFLVGMGLRGYTTERPQLLSFLLFAVMFVVLDGFARSGRRWLLYLLPPLAVVWANSHGGVVLGMVTLVLFAAGYALEGRVLRGAVPRPHSIALGAVAAASAGAILLAPNGLTTFEYLAFLQQSEIRDRVSEYFSPFAFWGEWASAPFLPYYWVFLVLAVAALFTFFSKERLKESGLVVVLALLSLTGYRYVPFFLLLAAPYAAKGLGTLIGRVAWSKVGAGAAAVLLGGWLLVSGYRDGSTFQRGVFEGRYPVGAVAFMRDNHIAGKMFNTMAWGGYLIWNLHPEVRAYIDGRMLDPKRVVPYTHILWVTPPGKQFFEHEKFDLVLIPDRNTLDSGGEQYPLIAYLQNDPQWQVLYHDASSYLFARR
jgi:hypothetical protein